MPTDLPKTWFVSFEVPKEVRKASAQRRPRSSESFPTELDAQRFARQKFEQGYIVTAGTINPCTPRRAIPSTVIHHWFAESSEPPLAEPASFENNKEPDLP
ncbi:hypothetical protein RX327_35580 [Bradyrhizobium sp. BEA-2-5]|uniref:hypothetical protein n=1 Tax=Bradyrhizobium TaxID=374 RepID=UPI0004089E63|nr:hypothetical protein [Bradyrhizobium sp. BEA-2-5]WOH80999.1 hypothetical protein RX327_35580 [Bradyrhizobium sp. BEA-2-5]